MPNLDGSLNCLVLNIGARRMIVPQSVMAEVISYSSMTPLSKASPWMHGLADWRSQRIPVLNIDQMCTHNTEAQRLDQARLAVLYGMERLPSVSYYAVEISGIPHPMRLTPEELQEDPTSEADSPVVKSCVVAAGKAMQIMDMALVEKAIHTQLLSMKL